MKRERFALSRTILVQRDASSNCAARMGKMRISLLIVAFACLAHGFKTEFDDVGNEVKEFKIPDMTEEQSIENENALEEPEESDVDRDLSFKDGDEQEEPIEDEEDDANEKRVENEFEAQLSRLENVDKKRLGDIDEDEAEQSPSGETLVGGKSVGWWGHHHHHTTIIHHHHYKTIYRYRYTLKCKAGGWVGGHIHSGKPIYKTIRFKPYFHRTPAIATGVQWLNSYGHHNIRFGVKVVAKSRTYMRIKLWTWGHHNGVHGLYVNWMACPQ